MVWVSDADITPSSSSIKVPFHLEKGNRIVGLELLEGPRQCGVSLPVFNQKFKRGRCHGSVMLTSRWKNAVK